ncbi:MAG TPA: hypothetical protein VFY43_01700 [Candidatus Limnocylindria bacterium]|nr:hypothetical protein [Candidatus Limnocylindria bacterium]
MRELRLGGEPLEAVLLPEVGARLHRLTVHGHDLLRTPADPGRHLEEPFFWGGYPMAPWCNRLAAGVTKVHGHTVSLAANFADGSAIHGQVATRPWDVAPDGSCSVGAGGDGWPWPYQVSLSAAIDGSELRMAWRLTNLADEPMPAGIGFHPWWRWPVRLRLDAESVYASNTQPAAEPAAVSGSLDLGRLAAPAAGLDGTWVATGVPLELAWPELGLRARLTTSAAARFVAVATPPDIDAIAVEPQTHAPDGLRRLLEGRPDGLAWLAPGDALLLEMRVEVSGA